MYEPFVQRYPQCDREKLSDILSGLYNAGFSLGTIIGPIAGSYITIYYKSFRVCCDIFGLSTLFYALILFVGVYLPLRAVTKDNN
jgi:MFS family permease